MDVRNMEVFVVLLCPKMPYWLIHAEEDIPLLRNDTTFELEKNSWLHLTSFLRGLVRLMLLTH